MLSKLKIKLKKNTEILALAALIFITIITTTYYNYNKNKVYANYKNTINNIYLKKTLDHLEIINKDLISIFKKNNIEPILCINKKLDPNFHQAMMEIEDDQKEPGIIIQEIQKGFMMRDRLLRPALVAVSKKTEKNTKNESDDNKSKENQDKSINK